MSEGDVTGIAIILIVTGLLLTGFHGKGWKAAGVVFVIYGALVGLIAAAERALLHFPS